MKTLTEEVLKKDILTEANINLLKNRANKGEVINFDDKEYTITQEQTEKGKAWLMNQWKTPTGKIRKNNPFGAREEEALETFESFTFDGFYNAGNSFVNFYVPIYTVIGKDSTFQYVLSGGLIKIIG